MGRIYKRQLGTRRYGNFSQEQIESAVSDVANGVRSLRDAARTYGVSYGTLHNRFHGRRTKKSGGQTVLSVIEEQSILKNILKCADWGFPLTQQDLKMFVVSVVPLKDIVALLPNPRCEKISNRIVKYHFQSDVNSKEC